MPIADLILTQIVDAGFEVEVGRPVEGDPHFYFVSARERNKGGAGRTWVCSGVTMTDAAAGLAEQLGLNVNEEMLQGIGKQGAKTMGEMVAGRGWGRSGISAAILAGVLTGMGVIFLLDLATPGLNVGVLYVVPLCVADWSGVKRRGLLILTAVMMGMVLVDAVVGRFSLLGGLEQEPAATLNRVIAMVAIGGSAATMLLLRECAGAEMRWMNARGNAGTWLRGLGKDWVMGAAAAGLMGLTFGMDVVTPVWADMAVLYLVPLGLLALAARRRVTWTAAGLVMGLVVLGYLASPRGGLGRQEARLVLENRWMTAVGLVIVVGVMEILGRWKRRPAP